MVFMRLYELDGLHGWRASSLQPCGVHNATLTLSLLAMPLQRDRWPSSGVSVRWPYWSELPSSLPGSVSLQWFLVIAQSLFAKSVLAAC